MPLRSNGFSGALAVAAIALAAGACTGTAMPQAPVDASTKPSEASVSASVAAPPPLPKPAGTPAVAPARDLEARIGLSCPADPDATCDSGEYDVERRPGCGDDGLFGGVSADTGALLVDRLPPEDTTRRATLAKGQIVCIEAIARAGQQPAWYFVTQFSPAAIAACTGNPLCETYGERPVTAETHGAGTACRAVSMGEVSAGCASGWTNADDIEAFSNGM